MPCLEHNSRHSATWLYPLNISLAFSTAYYRSASNLESFFLGISLALNARTWPHLPQSQSQSFPLLTEPDSENTNKTLSKRILISHAFNKAFTSEGSSLTHLLIHSKKLLPPWPAWLSG